MSTYVDEKLRPAERTLGDRARCYWKKHLQGKTLEILKGSEKKPELVAVTGMDQRWIWRFVREENKDRLMELERTEPLHPREAG